VADPYLKFIFPAGDCKKGAKFLFVKDPAEQYGVGFDFELVLPEDVFITSLTATAIDRRTGVDATATVIDGVTVVPNDDLDNTIACVDIKAGEVGHSYNVTVTVTFDDALPSIDVRCFEFNVKQCGR